MIGGFIKYESVCSGKHHFKQRQTCLFAAGQTAHRQKNIISPEKKSSQYTPHLRISVKPVRFLQLLQYGITFIKQKLSLIIVAEGNIMTCFQPPLRRRQFSNNHSEQRGLANSVRAYNTDALTAFYIQIYIVKKKFSLCSAAEFLGQFFCNYNIISRFKILFEMNPHTADFSLGPRKPFHMTKSFFS